MFRNFMPVLAWVLCAGSAFGGAVGLNDYSAWVSATQSGFNIVDFSTVSTPGGYNYSTSSAGFTISGINFLGFDTNSPAYAQTVLNPTVLSVFDFGSGNILRGPGYVNGSFQQKIQITLPAGYTSIGLNLGGLLDTAAQALVLGITLTDFSGNTITLTGTTSVTTPGTKTLTFFGATADTDIKYVNVFIIGPAPAYSQIMLDNFHYGVAQSQSGGGGDPEPGGETPEIATNLMIGFGLLLLYRTRRRQLPLAGC